MQAVAARSYALATDAGGPLFDQYSDTRSQVYRGMSAEQPSTNAAARNTAGQVVLYNGTVATTYYFSTSGGQTENVENVFVAGTLVKSAGALLGHDARAVQDEARISGALARGCPRAGRLARW